MTTDLKQCPYYKSTKCVMDEPCDGCETKAEYDADEYFKTKTVKTKKVNSNPCIFFEYYHK